MPRPPRTLPTRVDVPCINCGNIISIRYYDQKRHSGMCMKCAKKEVAARKIAKTDRDTIFLRKTLRNMKSRCNGKYFQYNSYSKKKISVCEEWLNNADAFVSWAKNNGWEHGLTIDRIDNNKGYSPDNCRWITNEQNLFEALKHRQSRGASSAVGVWFRKDTNKWSTEIKVNKKKITLGCFFTEKEAIIARENFIDEHNLVGYARNL